MIDNREWNELKGRARYIRLFFDYYLPYILGAIILLGIYFLTAGLPEFVHLLAPIRL